jgi:hypothetical protein
MMQQIPYGPAGLIAQGAQTTALIRSFRAGSFPFSFKQRLIDEDHNAQCP